MNADDVVASRFYDSTFGVQSALMRWSHDGGASWSDDLIVSDAYWANRVYFWDSSTGFATSINGNPNLEFRTASGGLLSGRLPRLLQRKRAFRPYRSYL